MKHGKNNDILTVTAFNFSATVGGCSGFLSRYEEHADGYCDVILVDTRECNVYIHAKTEDVVIKRN